MRHAGDIDAGREPSGAIGRALSEGYDRLVAVARRVVGDEHEARDAVQDACVSALRGAGGFEHRAQPSTWLHRIVINAALIRRRQHHRRGEHTFGLTGTSSTPRAGIAPSPEELVARAQLRTVVRRAIASLPEHHRAVLELRDLQQLGTADTASALGLTPNAAKIRLHRARRALRAALAPVGLQAAPA
jgi:RNA polymerase sigma-70 factor (ECF subfamily)